MLYLNITQKMKLRCWNGQTPKLPEKLFWQISGKYLILKNHKKFKFFKFSGKKKLKISARKCQNWQIFLQEIARKK